MKRVPFVLNNFTFPLLAPARQNDFTVHVQSDHYELILASNRGGEAWRIRVSLAWIKALALLGRTADARTALLEGLAADPDPDVRTRLLVELAALTDDSSGRAGRYDEAVSVNGNLVAAASACIALRAM